MDTCDSLLQELEVRKESLPIRAVNADLLTFREHVGGPIDVILCTGDTLTHLPSLSGVESLFAEVAASLSHGGLFVATFRDYVSTPLQGDGRFSYLPWRNKVSVDHPNPRHFRRRRDPDVSAETRAAPAVTPLRYTILPHESRSRR
jgi:hypothetical protein